jgi:hypothetical protein
LLREERHRNDDARQGAKVAKAKLGEKEVRGISKTIWNKQSKRMREEQREKSQEAQ